MQLKRYSDFPIVGQWIVLEEEENKAALASLSATQVENLKNSGWANTEYIIGNIRWPNALLKAVNVR